MPICNHSKITESLNLGWWSTGPVHAAEQVHQRRLARPASPHDRDELSRFDLQAHAIERADRLGAHLICAGEVDDLDDAPCVVHPARENTDTGARGPVSSRAMLAEFRPGRSDVPHMGTFAAARRAAAHMRMRVHGASSADPRVRGLAYRFRDSSSTLPGHFVDTSGPRVGGLAYPQRRGRWWRGGASSHLHAAREGGRARRGT